MSSGHLFNSYFLMFKYQIHATVSYCIINNMSHPTFLCKHLYVPM